MEFRFNLNDVFRQPITEVNHTLMPGGFKGDRRALWDTLSKVTDVLNEMGAASALAQGLTKPITTAERLRNSENQTVYVLVDPSACNGKGAVTGLLKTGQKGLYVFDREGHHYHVQSPCVLDFYVHESRQRSGLGKHLFEHMLQKEQVHPKKLAIDRPSEKFLGFLHKHYQLQNPIKQMNNYVVYDGFFPKDKDPMNNNSISPKNSRGSNGLQPQIVTSPYGRYGAPRPACSMGQIIHNQSAAVTPQEPTTGNAAPLIIEHSTPQAISADTQNEQPKQEQEQQQQQNGGDSVMVSAPKMTLAPAVGNGLDGGGARLPKIIRNCDMKPDPDVNNKWPFQRPANPRPIIPRNIRNKSEEPCDIKDLLSLHGLHSVSIPQTVHQKSLEGHQMQTLPNHPMDHQSNMYTNQTAYTSPQQDYLPPNQHNTNSHPQQVQQNYQYQPAISQISQNQPQIPHQQINHPTQFNTPTQQHHAEQLIPPVQSQPILPSQLNQQLHTQTHMHVDQTNPIQSVSQSYPQRSEQTIESQNQVSQHSVAGHTLYNDQGLQQLQHTQNINQPPHQNNLQQNVHQIQHLQHPQGLHTYENNFQQDLHQVEAPQQQQDLQQHQNNSQQKMHQHHNLQHRQHQKSLQQNMHQDQQLQHTQDMQYQNTLQQDPLNQQVSQHQNILPQNINHVQGSQTPEGLQQYQNVPNIPDLQHPQSAQFQNSSQQNMNQPQYVQQSLQQHQNTLPQNVQQIQETLHQQISHQNALQQNVNQIQGSQYPQGLQQQQLLQQNTEIQQAPPHMHAPIDIDTPSKLLLNTFKDKPKITMNPEHVKVPKQHSIFTLHNHIRNPDYTQLHNGIQIEYAPQERQQPVMTADRLQQGDLGQNSLQKQEDVGALTTNNNRESTLNQYNANVRPDHVIYNNTRIINEHNFMPHNQQTAQLNSPVTAIHNVPTPTNTLNRTEVEDKYNSRVHQNPVSNQLQQNPVNNELQQNPVNNQLQQNPVNSQLQQNPVNNQFQQNPVNNEFQKNPVNNQLQQNPVNSQLQQNPVNNQFQQNLVNNQLQQNPVNNQPQQNPVNNQLQQNHVNNQLQQNTTNNQLQQNFINNQHQQNLINNQRTNQNYNPNHTHLQNRTTATNHQINSTLPLIHENQTSYANSNIVYTDPRQQDVNPNQPRVQQNYQHYNNLQNQQVANKRQMTTYQGSRNMDNSVINQPANAHQIQGNYAEQLTVQPPQIDTSNQLLSRGNQNVPPNQLHGYQTNNNNSNTSNKSVRYINNSSPAQNTYQYVTKPQNQINSDYQQNQHYDIDHNMALHNQEQGKVVHNNNNTHGNYSTHYAQPYNHHQVNLNPANLNNQINQQYVEPRNQLANQQDIWQQPLQAPQNIQQYQQNTSRNNQPLLDNMNLQPVDRTPRRINQREITNKINNKPAINQQYNPNIEQHITSTNRRDGNFIPKNTEGPNNNTQHSYPSQVLRAGDQQHACLQNNSNAVQNQTDSLDNQQNILPQHLQNQNNQYQQNQHGRYRNDKQNNSDEIRTSSDKKHEAGAGLQITDTDSLRQLSLAFATDKRNQDSTVFSKDNFSKGQINPDQSGTSVNTANSQHPMHLLGAPETSKILYPHLQQSEHSTGASETDNYDQNTQSRDMGAGECVSSPKSKPQKIVYIDPLLPVTKAPLFNHYIKRKASSRLSKQVEQRSDTVKSKADTDDSYEPIKVVSPPKKQPLTSVNSLQRNMKTAVQREKERRQQESRNSTVNLENRKLEPMISQTSIISQGGRFATKCELPTAKSAEPPAAKLDRPQTLSLQTSESEVQKQMDGVDNGDGDGDDDDIDEVKRELENIENGVERVTIGENLMRPSSATRETPSSARRTPSHLTDQGYFDLKFYHNKLW